MINLEKIKTYIPLLTFTGLIGTVIGGVYFFGGFMKTVEDGMFTPIQKVKVIDHVDTAPNDVDMFLATKTLDSISKLNVTEARENLRRDSIRDENVKRNTITVFQMKSTQDTILKKLNKYISIHDNN